MSVNSITAPEDWQLPHKIVHQLETDVQAYNTSFVKGQVNLAKLATPNSDFSYVPMTETRTYNLTNDDKVLKQQNASIYKPGITVQITDVFGPEDKNPQPLSLPPVVYNLPNFIINSSLAFKTQGWTTDYSEARDTFQDIANFSPNPYTGNRMVTNVNKTNPQNWNLRTSINLSLIKKQANNNGILISFWAQKKVNWTCRVQMRTDIGKWFSITNPEYQTGETSTNWSIINILIYPNNDAFNFITSLVNFDLYWIGVDVNGGYLSDFGLALFGADNPNFSKVLAKYPCAITPTGGLYRA